jgi:hypothetical protein
VCWPPWPAETALRSLWAGVLQHVCWAPWPAGTVQLPQGVRVAGSRCARIPLPRLRGRVVAPCPRSRLLWLSGFLDPRRRLLVGVVHFSSTACACAACVVADSLQRLMSPRLTDHPMAGLPHRRSPAKGPDWVGTRSEGLPLLGPRALGLRARSGISRDRQPVLLPL